MKPICECCGREITGHAIDGWTWYGQWKLMCITCFCSHTAKHGLGWHYKRQGDQLVKVGAK